MEASNTEKKAMSAGAHELYVGNYRKKFGRGKAAQEIWEKVEARKARRAPSPSITEQLYRSKLQAVADALPTTGHSMGSIQRVKLIASNLEAKCERCEHYSRGCKWAPTYGELVLTISAKRLDAVQIIGGLVTIVGGRTRTPGVRHAEWIERVGNKSSARLEWRKGFLHVKGRYHHIDIEHCAAIGNDLARCRAIQEKAEKEHAAKVKKMPKCAELIGYRDSILAGNCDPGTKAFAQRHGLDIGKKYRFRDILAMADAGEKAWVEKIFWRISAQKTTATQG